jgi:hypothetical protein
MDKSSEKEVRQASMLDSLIPWLCMIVLLSLSIILSGSMRPLARFRCRY